MIVKLERTQSNTQQNMEQTQDPTMGISTQILKDITKFVFCCSHDWHFMDHYMVIFLYLHFQSKPLMNL